MTASKTSLLRSLQFSGLELGIVMICKYKSDSFLFVCTLYCSLLSQSANQVAACV